MKKIILALSVFALFVACDKKKTNNDDSIPTKSLGGKWSITSLNGKHYDKNGKLPVYPIKGVVFHYVP